jgi:hypothetical protein
MREVMKDATSDNANRRLTMKALTTFALAAVLLLGLTFLSAPSAQAQTCQGNGKNFVDLNGDGFNDNAPDHDGDGIPNGLDDDYIKAAKDGSGQKNGQAIADKQTHRKRVSALKFNRVRNWTRSQVDGGAFGGGRNGSGTGICDGTGPHGRVGQNGGANSNVNGSGNGRGGGR